MPKQGLVIIADYTQKENPLTLEELSQICRVSSALIQELIAYDIIRPIGDTSAEWHFDLQQLQRVQKVLRLQRDLEVNLAGIAVILDLMEELEDLRATVNVIERHY